MLAAWGGQVHCGAISRLCVSHDEAYLFTASEDGQLFMFELVGEGAVQRERGRRKDEDTGQELDTVLVSKAELLERIAGAEELEQKVPCKPPVALSSRVAAPLDCCAAGEGAADAGRVSDAPQGAVLLGSNKKGQS